MSENLVKVANASDLAEGEARVFEVDNIPIALCNVDGKFYAIENVCTHDDGPLGEGELFGTEIECPRHGARFDVTTGEVRKPPAYMAVKTFPVRVENGEVFVDISDY